MKKKMTYGALIIVGLYIGYRILGVFIGQQMYNFNALQRSSSGGIATMEVPETGGGFGSISNPIVGGLSLEKSSITSPSPDVAPTTPGEVEDRLVIRNSSLSMVVKDVAQSIQDIGSYAKENEGYLVESSLEKPLDEARGYVTIRVPEEKLDAALGYIRGLAVKVTSEQTTGLDVTEEYVDLESQLRNFEASEQQFLRIMERANTVDEILKVQRELTSVRSQIERTKGRMEYLEKSAAMSRITVSLALDEESLPMAPTEKWRPVVAFRLAVRGLLNFLKSLSYRIIWLVVYAIVWVPALLILWWLRKRFWKKKE